MRCSPLLVMTELAWTNTSASIFEYTSGKMYVPPACVGSFA